MIYWFKACGVTSVAMEFTGVYWIAAYEILEQHGFEVILVNARYAKNVPGRKTDVSDAAWLRQLHSYGLLRGSFRPNAEIATLRAYLRQRERLVEYAAAHIQHMQKALMEMNLQLHHVVSDITGATGMRIIRAIVAGERNPDVLTTYRDVRCHASIETIRAALVGNDRDEHVFALTQSLELYDTYQAKMLDCDRKLESMIAALTDRGYLLILCRCAWKHGCHTFRIDVEGQEYQRLVARVSPLVHEGVWFIDQGTRSPCFRLTVDRVGAGAGDDKV